MGNENAKIHATESITNVSTFEKSTEGESYEKLSKKSENFIDEYEVLREIEDIEEVWEKNDYDPFDSEKVYSNLENRKIVGVGTNGVVFKTKNKKTSQRGALKCIPLRFQKDKKAEEKDKKKEIKNKKGVNEEKNVRECELMNEVIFQLGKTREVKLVKSLESKHLKLILKKKNELNDYQKEVIKNKISKIIFGGSTTTNNQRKDCLKRQVDHIIRKSKPQEENFQGEFLSEGEKTKLKSLITSNKLQKEIPEFYASEFIADFNYQKYFNKLGKSLDFFETRAYSCKHPGLIVPRRAWIQELDYSYGKVIVLFEEMRLFENKSFDNVFSEKMKEIIHLIKYHRVSNTLENDLRVLDKYIKELKSVFYNVMFQIIKTIEALHKNDTYHGDIKLENIFVNEVSEDGTILAFYADMGTSSGMYRNRSRYLLNEDSYPGLTIPFELKDNQRDWDYRRLIEMVIEIDKTIQFCMENGMYPTKNELFYFIERRKIVKKTTKNPIKKDKRNKQIDILYKHAKEKLSVVEKLINAYEEDSKSKNYGTEKTIHHECFVHAFKEVAEKDEFTNLGIYDNTIRKKFGELEKENKELKERINKVEEENKELKEENKEMKKRVNKVEKEIKNLNERIKSVLQLVKNEKTECIEKEKVVQCLMCDNK